LVVEPNLTNVPIYKIGIFKTTIIIEMTPLIGRLLTRAKTEGP